MSLSESSDNDVSSDEEHPPAKRPRADTYGASSNTSQGSAVQDSEDEHTDHHYKHKEVNYNERTDEDHSHFNDVASSPTDEEDYRPSLGGYNPPDNGEDNFRPSFQSESNSFYKNPVVDERLEKKYSHTSQRIMSKMGHKLGKGLGKLEDGRVEPVEAITQKGKRGLGMKPSVVGELPSNLMDFQWTPEDSPATAQEKVYWIPDPPEETLSADLLEDWLQKGPEKLTIDDETNFVDPHILQGIVDAKSRFDELHDEDLRMARFRSNPYETIGSAIFLNRAAVKMANMDALFDYMFTNPVRKDGRSVLENKKILYFADVCAGPGGFSEYVLYRMKWKAKGFGFTLKGPCDFKTSDFYAGTPETFDAYYGVKDNGDIYDPDNLKSLKNYVLSQTDDMGVHFLMADGGFSVVGKENIQEILSKRLYLCQCLAALMLVRTEGHFVVKLFDCFTKFTIGLIYIMYRCFEKVSIHKPVTSRPANSERYLVCKWKKVGTEPVENHLFYVNTLLGGGLNKGEDINELVPLSVLQENQEFFDYIYKSNTALGEKQIKNLLKIAQFTKDKTLEETSQAALRTECLHLWRIPDQMRKQPPRLKPDDMLAKILSQLNPPKDPKVFKKTILTKPPAYLEKPEELKRQLPNVYDWYYMYLSGHKSDTDMTVFIGCGGKQVYQLQKDKWKHVVELTLPPMTFLYGEITSEFKGEGSGQFRSKAFHIIDALMLGGEDISQLALSERKTQCMLFCTALEKPDIMKNDIQQYQMRCKKLFPLYKLPGDIEDLQCRPIKNARRAVTVRTRDKNGNGRFYTVGSVLFVKEIKAPWKAHISKRTNNRYYYRMNSAASNLSQEDFPEDAKLDMISGYGERIMWTWGDHDNAIAIYESIAKKGVTVDHIKKYVIMDVAR